MKKYQVTDVHGVVHSIECDFMFNNAGELVFRVGERGNTDVVAMFAAGQWSSCVKLKKEQ